MDYWLQPRIVVSNRNGQPTVLLKLSFHFQCYRQRLYVVFLYYYFVLRSTFRNFVYKFKENI